MDAQLKLDKFISAKAEMNTILIQIMNGAFGEQS